MPTLTPFLWFDTQAEEAMTLYTSIFKNSKVISVNRARRQGDVRGVRGQRPAFMALNGGPHVQVHRGHLALRRVRDPGGNRRFMGEAHADGGAPSRCGWLKDKFGLSWQIVPTALGRMLGDPDPAKSKRTLDAMLQMQKLDLNQLQQAYDGN